nr:hypothetical protein [Planctomycetota bacterium]
MGWGPLGWVADKASDVAGAVGGGIAAGADWLTEDALAGAADLGQDVWGAVNAPYGWGQAGQGALGGALGWIDQGGNQYSSEDDVLTNLYRDITGWGGWGAAKDVYDWQKDVYDDTFGLAPRLEIGDLISGGTDVVNAIRAADAGFDPLRDAAGLLAQGDLSGAIGAYAGGTADQVGDFYTEVLVPASEAAADAEEWLGRELGETATNFGQNLYSNWGLQDLLQAADQQAMNFGQWSSQRFEDLEALKDRALREAGEFITGEAVPYFQQDFLEDVTNLGQGAVDWGTDAYQDYVFPFYEENIKPLGSEMADLATDVYGDYIEPAYQQYLRPAGLAAADWATDTAYPWLRDEAVPYVTNDLRHDISDVLETIPAGLRGLLPEGSRADAALEAAVGGIDTAFEAVTETAPGAVADFVGQGYGYLFDPSQPGFGGDAAAGGVTPEEQAYFEQAVAAGFFGPSGAGAGAPAAAPAAAAAAAGAPAAAAMAPAVTPAGPMVAYPGGEAGAGPLMSPQEVAEQIYEAAQGRGGGGLSDLYADMYGAQRTWAQDAYDAQMRGAAAAGQAAQDYAATVLQQGEQAA